MTPEASQSIDSQAVPAFEQARIEFDGHVARSTIYGDVYASADGAAGQAHHVFLQGNDLPERWQGKPSFAILETGFGLGTNFLTTVDTWLADPQRPTTLHYVAIECHPPSLDDLQKAHQGQDSTVLRELLDQWPALVPGLHPLRLQGGAVRLTLAWGDAPDLMRQLQGPFDAFFLDGFAPSRNPRMWGRAVLGQLARLASPGATAATWSAARLVRDGLQASGFDFQRSPGFGAKRDMIRAHLPRERVGRPPPGRLSRREFGWTAGTTRVAVLGAGLAGAACARAMADRGWSVDLFEAEASPAQGASGNPAGLIHATVHGEDGHHARLHRAAALLAARWGQEAIATGRVKGELLGLLSLDRQAGEPVNPKPWPYEQTARRVSAEWVAPWLRDPTAKLDTHAQAGKDSHPTHPDAGRGGWFYPQGGWINPPSWVRHWLDHPRIRTQLGRKVSRLRWLDEPTADSPTGCWQLSDEHGATLLEAPIVILALGDALPEWLARQGLPVPELGLWRGQLSWLSAPDSDQQARPLTGQGYVAPHPDGGLCFGATSQLDDLDPTVRPSDHEVNLARLQSLTGWDFRNRAAELNGRVAWRLQSRDKLPLVGAWPDLPTWTATGRRNQLRHMPRLPGLYVSGALGSRGLAWAPLAGELIASLIEGTPLPLENDLVEALDPGRFWVREDRRALSRS